VPQRNDSPGFPGTEPRPAEGGVGAPRHARRPPWETGSEPQSGASFGTWLRRQREAREITLREIADRTKISLRYLEAMEEDRFDVLPAPLFAKGFLREYARYVGLSPDEVVNHYLSVTSPQEEEPGEKTMSVIRRKAGQTRSWAFYLFFVVAGLLLLGLVAVFAFWNEKRRAEPSAAAEAPPIAAPPAATVQTIPPPPPPAEEPAAPIEVTLDFTGTCWVDVLIDGKQRIAEEHVQGESLPIAAQESVVFVTIGNAGGVNIQVNGQPFPIPGKAPGKVIRDLTIDLETVQALRARREAR
jgi:cytoskeletal protein RodZ